MAFHTTSPIFVEPASLMRFMTREENRYNTVMESKFEEDSDAPDHTRCIMAISQEAADRLKLVINAFKRTFHYGFLPLVIYLGWTHGPDKGNPPFSITNFLCFY